MVLGWFFLLLIIPLSKYDHMHVILLVSFKKISIYIYIFERYYICYIVGIIEKDKYSFFLLDKYSLLQ